MRVFRKERASGRLRVRKLSLIQRSVDSLLRYRRGMGAAPNNKSHPHMATIVETPQNEGGQAATVVELRQ